MKLFFMEYFKDNYSKDLKLTTEGAAQYDKVWDEIETLMKQTKTDFSLITNKCLERYLRVDFIKGAAFGAALCGAGFLSKKLKDKKSESNC